MYVQWSLSPSYFIQEGVTSFQNERAIAKAKYAFPMEKLLLDWSTVEVVLRPSTNYWWIVESGAGKLLILSEHKARIKAYPVCTTGSGRLKTATQKLFILIASFQFNKVQVVIVHHPFGNQPFDLPTESRKNKLLYQGQEPIHLQKTCKSLMKEKCLCELKAWLTACEAGSTWKSSTDRVNRSKSVG